MAFASSPQRFWRPAPTLPGGPGNPVNATPRKEHAGMQRLFYLTVLVAVLGLLVLGCENSTNPVEVPFLDQNGISSLAKAENTTIKSSDSFPFSFFNNCTEEVVSGVVSVKTTIHITTDGNGGFHFHFHDVFNGRAVGETSGI